MRSRRFRQPSAARAPSQQTPPEQFGPPVPSQMSSAFASDSLSKDERLVARQQALDLHFKRIAQLEASWNTVRPPPTAASASSRPSDRPSSSDPALPQFPAAQPPPGAAPASRGGVGGWRALMRHYASVTGSAWSERSRRAPDVDKQAVELEFLPAHLELIETPVHPAARAVQWVIVTMVVVVLLIAIFGQLDIVSTAKGRLVPDARVKVIQPALTGVVRQIAVRDGQRVKAGDLLMELDATQAAADANKAQSARVDSQLSAARARALLEAERSGRAPKLAAVTGAPSDRVNDAKRLAEGTYREYVDQLKGAKAELRKREAELASTRGLVASLEATAPLARQQADDLAKLLKDAYVAKHDYLGKQRIAIEQEHELAVRRSQAQELEAGISQQKAAIASLSSQFRRTQLDAANRAAEQLVQLNNDETKAHTRQELLSLRSPVDGTVQQLNVHTLGGVVTTAQTLMEIVPDDSLEVEAQIENKDIGFVNVGQRAIVKLEAFPYTRYGYLSGEVVSLSSDAVRDRRLGLVFVARVRLDTNRIQANDKWITLTSGMAVTAEILTGRRSVARYFLDPLLQTSQQSLRER